ncbi:MAG: hypothetical protein COT43_05430 [Candidatus Marinimicrobia bacterium CG08_land_8_20_14_0_20_45_22]|nr:MAG: hypothetical protein COT43_05430 [Candidatus Marinimicrobia bacterium CG08_land_8_20_14_0_20_45_22]
MNDDGFTTGSSFTPEQLARIQIDAQLVLCGWIIQNVNSIDFGAGIGIAIRELQSGAGLSESLEINILKRVFEGRLVLQNPPAERLLERIRGRRKIQGNLLNYLFTSKNKNKKV